MLLLKDRSDPGNTLLLESLQGPPTFLAPQAPKGQLPVSTPSSFPSLHPQLLSLVRGPFLVATKPLSSP